MNRLTQIKMQQQMNDKELELGLAGGASWHDQYKDSAYVYCGGFPFDLTDGDIIAVMSQCVFHPQLSCVGPPRLSYRPVSSPLGRRINVH